MVNYTTIAVATSAQTEREFTISITHELVPSFRLLVFFAREDGELIADLMEIKVKCKLKEKVRSYLTGSHILLFFTPGKCSF